jgi:hypothetical protein
MPIHVVTIHQLAHAKYGASVDWNAIISGSIYTKLFYMGFKCKFVFLDNEMAKLQKKSSFLSPENDKILDLPSFKLSKVYDLK